MVAPRYAFGHGLTSRGESQVALLCAIQATIDIVERMLEGHQTGLCGVGNGLGRGTGLRGGRGGFMTGEGIAMDQSMARGSALDLSQTDEIPPFEIAVPMFEFPEGRVGRARVEDVAH